jgi:hypothetical protein
MSKKEISSIYITCEEIDGKEAYRTEVNYKSKQSISQKRGWVPSSMGESEKFTSTSCETLCKKLKEVLGGCSK